VSALEERPEVVHGCGVPAGPSFRHGCQARDEVEWRYHLASRSRCWAAHGVPNSANGPRGLGAEPPNKRMQLTKLRAAPVRAYKVPPCAPAGETDGVTASQLIRSVRPTI
jgi:hypothetical protein